MISLICLAALIPLLKMSKEDLDKQEVAFFDVLAVMFLSAIYLWFLPSGYALVGSIFLVVQIVMYAVFVKFKHMGEADAILIPFVSVLSIPNVITFYIALSVLSIINSVTFKYILHKEIHPYIHVITAAYAISLIL